MKKTNSVLNLLKKVKSWVSKFCSVYPTISINTSGEKSWIVANVVIGHHSKAFYKKDSELDFINWTEIKDKKGRTLSSVGKGKYISGLLFNRRLKIFPKCVLSLLKNVDETLRYWYDTWEFKNMKMTKCTIILRIEILHF